MVRYSTLLCGVVSNGSANGRNGSNFVIVLPVRWNADNGGSWDCLLAIARKSMEEKEN